MTLFISVAILVLIILSIGVLFKSYRNNLALGVIYLKFITGLAIIALVWRVKTLGIEWNSIWLFIAFFAILVLSLMILASATLFARTIKPTDQAIWAILCIVSVLLAFAAGCGLYRVLSTIFQAG